MNLGFFRAFGKVKAQGVVDGLTTRIIASDLEGATEAQLVAYDNKLAEISQKLAREEANYNREQGEAEAARDNYNNHVAAVQDLQGQVDAASDAGQKEALQASLHTLLDETERLRAVAQKEIDEAASAKEIFEAYREARDDMAAKLRSARQNMKDAATRIQKANLDEQRSKDLLDAQRTKAGLKGGDNSIDIVLNSMDTLARKAEERAAANRAHSEGLKPIEKPVDKNIEAALAKASGKSLEPSNTSERISSLKPL